MFKTLMAILFCIEVTENANSLQFKRLNQIRNL